MSTNYSEVPTYLAIAGLIVSLAAHFGIVINQNDVISAIGSGVAIYGVIHQWIISRRMKNAAVTAGAIIK